MYIYLLHFVHSAEKNWNKGINGDFNTTFGGSLMTIKLIGNNFETNYPVGHWFTVGYIIKTIKDIRKDDNGFNEYLLSDNDWVTGRYITFCSD